MSKVIYSMSVSLDGYIADRDGGIGWTHPSEQLHRHFNRQVEQAAAMLDGRRNHELMAEFWPTADRDPSLAEHELEFARIWRETPKIVFSRTRTDFEWASRVVAEDAGAVVEELKREPGGPLLVGGAGLASGLSRLGLIDSYQPVIRPVVLGGGTPFLQEIDRPLRLELVGQRGFDGGALLFEYVPAAG